MASDPEFFIYLVLLGACSINVAQISHMWERMPDIRAVPNRWNIALSVGKFLMVAPNTPNLLV